MTRFDPLGSATAAFDALSESGAQAPASCLLDEPSGTNRNTSIAEPVDQVVGDTSPAKDKS
jgi:hypothetical protein